jgi:hypothetical protein
MAGKKSGSANTLGSGRTLFMLGIALFVGMFIGFYVREATDGFLTDKGHDDEHARLRAGRLLPQDHPRRGHRKASALVHPAREAKSTKKNAESIPREAKSTKKNAESMPEPPTKASDSRDTSHLVSWEQARQECFQLASGSSSVFISVRAEHRKWPACQAFAGDNKAFISSFRVVDALNGKKNAVSFESCRTPGHFLRHNGNNVVVEPPKVPDAATWRVTQKESCIQLTALGGSPSLRVDPRPAPSGRLDMAQGSTTCLQMRKASLPRLPQDACKPESASDAVKVASMADGGQPCRLIPLMECPGDVPGTSIGEHGLCNTKDIQRDLKERTCLVYGIGISDNWDFEKAMAKKGCEVHAFDPTIDRPPSDESKNLPNLHFHRWGLAGETKESGTHMVAGTKSGATETSQPMLTLDDIVKRLGHENRRLSVFKIDCEGCEWAAMAAVSDSLWDRIDQLSLELHYGIELMLDSKAQVRKAAAFADALREHGFADYRSDVRDGYAHHQRLMPMLYEAGMPKGFCCRLSGFVRKHKKQTDAPPLPVLANSGSADEERAPSKEAPLSFEDAKGSKTCFQLANRESDIRLSVRAENQPWPACGAFAGEGTAFASSFKVVQAVDSSSADEAFSLESCRHPGHFLRHNGNVIVVEPPKVPSDAVWVANPMQPDSDCVVLRATNQENILHVDEDASPRGRVEMKDVVDADDEACLKIRRPPSTRLVSEDDCLANHVSDAVKVASMADRQPCALIPPMKCSTELAGAAIGEHGLCNTKAMKADLADSTCLV